MGDLNEEFYYGFINSSASDYVIISINVFGLFVETILWTLNGGF